MLTIIQAIATTPCLSNIAHSISAWFIKHSTFNHKPLIQAIPLLDLEEWPTHFLWQFHFMPEFTLLMAEMGLALLQS